MTDELDRMHKAGVVAVLDLLEKKMRLEPGEVFLVCVTVLKAWYCEDQSASLRSVGSLFLDLADGMSAEEALNRFMAGEQRSEAVAAERERCAAICRKVADDHYSAWAEVCETRIRSGREP